MLDLCFLSVTPIFCASRLASRLACRRLVVDADDGGSQRLLDPLLAGRATCGRLIDIVDSWLHPQRVSGEGLMTRTSPLPIALDIGAWRGASSRRRCMHAHPR